MAYVIGVDIGTYEAKGVVVDEAGSVVATAMRRHALSVPRPGFAEHDAEEVWWGGFVAIVGDLLAAPSVSADDVVAVCTSGIGPCVLPIDQNGVPLRPAILYGVDVRAGAEIEALLSAHDPDKVFEWSGNELTSQSAGPKIAWIRANEPEVFAHAARFITCQTFLVGRLTGRWIIDHGTAAYFNPLYDIRRRDWCADETGIVEGWRLPELAWAEEVAGTVTADAAARTGLRIGTPVLVGAADAPVEALSAGVQADGDLMIMYGSSHFLIQVMDDLTPTPTLYSAPYLFPGTSVLAAGTSTAGTITRWLADLTGQDGPTAFADMAREAASSPPGARGLLALPHFSGERTPHNDPTLTGGLLGLTLGHGRADVYRAFLEGIGHSVADVLRVYADAQCSPRRIAAVGGGTKNAVWVQAISDIAGVSQETVHGQGASFGDAMLAALAAGFVSQRTDLAAWVDPGATSDPRPEYAELYAEQAALLAGFRTTTIDIARRAGRLRGEQE